SLERRTESHRRHRAHDTSSRRVGGRPEYAVRISNRDTLMMQVQLRIPFYLPNAAYRVLRSIKRQFVNARASRTINLLRDRDIEFSWTAAHMPAGPGEALDFGPGGSHLGLLACQRGFNVTALDREPIQWPYIHPRLSFRQNDVLTSNLPERHF